MKRLSNGETLNEPQLLPENWGPIFGMQNVIEKLSDLSWTGDPNLEDKGWFIVGEAPPSPASPVLTTKSEIEWNKAKELLQKSDWSVMPDVPMSKNDRALWIEYRRELREIRLQSEFPDNIVWPKRPE